MREMTITVDDGLYETLRPMVEQRTIGDLLAAFVKSRFAESKTAKYGYTEAELEAGYRAMAADEEYEREAREWIEGLIGDIGDEEE